MSEHPGYSGKTTPTCPVASLWRSPDALTAVGDTFTVEVAGDAMPPNEQAFVMQEAEPASAQQFHQASMMIVGGLILCIPYAAIRLSAARKSRHRVKEPVHHQNYLRLPFRTSR